MVKLTSTVKMQTKTRCSGLSTQSAKISSIGSKGSNNQQNKDNQTEENTQGR